MHTSRHPTRLPYTRTPMHPYTRTPIHPYTRTPIYPYTRTPVHPYTLPCCHSSYALIYSPSLPTHECITSSRRWDIYTGE
eukprot:1250381-Amorphochlora_amoeboformis.AAC.1